MKGRQLTTIEECLELSGKCVYIQRIGARLPVAFIQNWQARYLYNLVKSGQVFEWKNNPKKSKNERI